MGPFLYIFPYQQTQIQEITNGKKEISTRIDSSDHLYVCLIKCGSRGQAQAPVFLKKEKNRWGGRERERREKKRGKRKRDIKKLSRHNLFFLAYIGLR